MTLQQASHTSVGLLLALAVAACGAGGEPRDPAEAPAAVPEPPSGGPGLEPEQVTNAEPAGVDWGPPAQHPRELHARILARSPMLGGQQDPQRAFDERLRLCREGDEETLALSYPGHLDFYSRVVSPPAYREEPVDAVVVIGISGSLVRRAKKVLESGMAPEALKVQVRSPGSSSGFSPNPYAQRTNTTPDLFMGYYTPRIERMMEARRRDCDALKNSAFMQGACRRDLTVAIVREWLQPRPHQSVRIILSRQTTWPEYALLFQRKLAEYDVRIDPDFGHTVPRRSTFKSEICGPSTEELWVDYPFYVRTLLAGA